MILSYDVVSKKRRNLRLRADRVGWISAGSYATRLKFRYKGSLDLKKLPSIRWIWRDMSMNYGEVIEIDVGEVGAEVRQSDAFVRREVAADLCVGDAPPLVTVYFQAYNHLEDQTKMAIHSILQYTQDVDHELLLVDNGSTDGTLDFFRSIPHPRKRIFHVKENRGALFGYLAAKGAAGNAFIRGKYFAPLPSDVLVTKNWLKNLVACMESDPRIGMVVPVASYASYGQQSDLRFSTYGEMQEAAAAHNVSDPKKWE